MVLLRSALALAAAVLLAAPRASATTWPRLPRPRVYFVLAAHGFAPAALPGIDLSALAKVERLRARRAERGRALLDLRRRWAEELVPEPAAALQALDRFFPAPTLRAYRTVLGASRARALAALGRLEREVGSRLSGEARRLEREAARSLRALRSRLEGADRAGAPDSALYVRARTSLELAALESLRGEATSLEDSAIADLERLLLAAPDDPLSRHARLHLAELLARRARRAAALAALHPLLCRAADPEQAEYSRCPAPTRRDALLERGWFLAGELQLEREPGRAAAAYARALGAGAAGTPLHAAARFQAGLAAFRLDRSEAAAGELDQLLRLAARGAAAALRAPALELLSLVYGDYEWEGRMEPRSPRVSLRVSLLGGKRIYHLEQQQHGITAEDALANLDRRFHPRRGEPLVPELYLEVARLYRDSTRLVGAATMARRILDRWPLHAAGPEALELLLVALEQQRLFERADAKLHELAGRFAPGTAWRRANQDSERARSGLRRLGERLRASVVFHLLLADRIPASARDELCRAVAAARASEPYLPRVERLARELAARSASCAQPAPGGLDAAERELAARIRRWTGRPRPPPSAPGRSEAATSTIARALTAAPRPPWERCLAEAPAPALELSLGLDLAPDGRVRAVELLPAVWAGSELGRCVGDAMRRLRVTADDVGGGRAVLTLIWL
jgi:hypothetical protein